MIFYSYTNFWKNNNEDQKNKENGDTSKVTQAEQQNTEFQENIEFENFLWSIEIPAISLKAPIENGTDVNTLKKAVGHFEESSLMEGNIGLAAHNRRL